MADYHPVQESDLETAPTPSAGAVGNGEGDLGGYHPVDESDLAPPPGAVEPGFRGFRGGTPNIPAAAAARFHASDSIANIFNAAGTAYGKNFVANYGAMNDASMQDLVAAGYGKESGYGPGALLQHMADAVNSGLTLGVNGVMAGISTIPAAGGAGFGQAVKEFGGTQTEADRAEREGNFDVMAGLSDVGSMHANAMLDAAKAGGAEAAAGEAAAKAAVDEARQIADARAQLSAPGVWKNYYRVDDAPGGGLTRTAMGEMPDGAVAAEQAKVVADALHLPPETATLIHQTYLDTGRPPAEVLMDAQTNHGGVLDDLVAGKVPTAYQGPGRAMTPEELGAAKAGGGPAEEMPITPAETASGGAKSAVPGPAADAALSTPEQGVSKIGQSIEQKAIDRGVTDGFLSTAGYDVKTVKGQTALVSDLITKSPDDMNAIVNGEKPLPRGIDPSMFIAGVESVIEQTKDWDLQARLANSPVVTKTSEAAATMRFAQEREPDSTTALLRELQQANIKQAGGPAKIAQKQAPIKAALGESNGVFLPKEEQRWAKFLIEIAC